jgi:hypothetical protein
MSFLLFMVFRFHGRLVLFLFLKFKTFKPFNRCLPFKPPPSSFPATRGGKRWGWNDWNERDLRRR